MHTISLASVWFGFGNGPLYIPPGPAMGSPSPAGSSVLLGSYPSELPQNNSTISDDFSFARSPRRKTFWDSPWQYIWRRWRLWEGTPRKALPPTCCPNTAVYLPPTMVLCFFRFSSDYKKTKIGDLFFAQKTVRLRYVVLKTHPGKCVVSTRC